MNPQEALNFLFGASREAALKASQHVKCQECKDVLLAALTPQPQSKENPEEENTDDTAQ